MPLSDHWKIINSIEIQLLSVVNERINHSHSYLETNKPIHGD